MEGRKYDSDKTRWDLVQPLALQEYAQVMTYGAHKYEPDNWRKVPDAKKRYFSALLRHVWAWWLGEKIDHESGRHHLGHAMCCLTFLLEPELEEEDRNRSLDAARVSLGASTRLKEVPRGKTK